MNVINNNIKTPTVSIFCMVYNHEPFIRDCLEGFLMQKCNFDFEIVLGEDCSTDNSREIILEYASKFPEKFKLFLHDKNIGAVQNQKIVFENCTGKYIAMCEGDDYWTDPLKLQKQFDFMELNNQIIITTHNASVKKKDDLKINNYVHEKMNSNNGFIDLLESCSFPTASFFFRNNFLSIKEINILNKALVGDWILMLLLLRHGDLYYSNNVQCVYNVHSNNVWANKSKEKQIKGKINIYEFISENMNLNKNESEIVISNINSNIVLLIKEKTITLKFSLIKELIFLINKNGLKKSFFLLIKPLIPTRIKTVLRKI